MSAFIKPRWISLWILPAASGAVDSYGIVQDLTSFSPQVKKLCNFNKLKLSLIILFKPGSLRLYSIKNGPFSFLLSNDISCSMDPHSDKTFSL